MKPRENDSESGFTLIEVIITIVIVAVVAAMMTTYFGTSITQSSIPIFRLNAAASLNEILEKISAQYGQYPRWKPNTTYAAGAIIVPTTLNRNGLKYITGGGTSGSLEPTWPAAGTVADGSLTWTQNGAAPTLAPLVDQAWQSGKIYSANSIVVNGSNQYVTTGGGTSGGSTPIWASATTIGSTVTPIDGTVTWRWSSSTVPTVILQTLIGAEGSDLNNTLGNYRVIQNRFIKFNTSVSPATEVDLTGSTIDRDYGKYLKVTIGLPMTVPNRTDETLTTLFVLW
jgi:prepilin-type N-terminal cleavage/methylation domain-containing protein